MQLSLLIVCHWKTLGGGVLAPTKRKRRLSNVGHQLVPDLGIFLGMQKVEVNLSFHTRMTKTENELNWLMCADGCMFFGASSLTVCFEHPPKKRLTRCQRGRRVQSTWDEQRIETPTTWRWLPVSARRLMGCCKEVKEENKEKVGCEKLKRLVQKWVDDERKQKDTLMGWGGGSGGRTLLNAELKSIGTPPPLPLRLCMNLTPETHCPDNLYVNNADLHPRLTL